MKWTSADIPDQHGRTIVITGANSGLGLRSAEALARKGATLVLGCRNQEKAATALDAVTSVAAGEPPSCIPLDLADLSSVQVFADELARRVDHVDVLMNNAGVMAIPLRRTADGFEMQFGTNHLGHFALTGRLLPLLLSASAPRVVTTSSQAHRIGRMNWNDLQWRKRYFRWPAYGQSKLANLLFTAELDRRARAAGTPLLAAAAHPGYANTHLQAVGAEMTGNKFMARVMDLGNQLVAQTDEQGAWPQLYAATMDSVHGGDYFGPDGFFERAGHPEKVGTTRAAANVEDARRLWELSEQATGVTFDWSKRPATT